MNKKRRAALDEIKLELQNLQGRLEALRDEEQGAFEALPESFQQAQGGQAMEGNAEALSDSVDELQSAIDNIENGQA